MTLPPALSDKSVHARAQQTTRGRACVSLALVALLGGCSRPPPQPEPIRSVRTLTVVAASAGGTQDFPAEIRARIESRLAFRVGGKIVSRSAEVGRRVGAGTVLARLDAADLQLGTEAARATVRAAQTQYKLAAAELERYRGLRDQGFISSAELERRETTALAQQAQLEQAVAQARVQSNQSAYAELRAPAAGVVTSVDAEVGNVVAAGASIIRLAHDGPRDAVFSVPETALGAFRALQERDGAVTVRAWSDTRSLPARVREIAAAADPATRTFLVKADLGNAGLELGRTATVSIERPRQQGIARLPLAAVVQQQGVTSVWLVDAATMTVRLQPIGVGGADGNDVVVSAGLSPGQLVVTAGVHVLTPGQKVRLLEPTPPAIAPVSAGPAAPASR